LEENFGNPSLSWGEIHAIEFLMIFVGAIVAAAALANDIGNHLWTIVVKKSDLGNILNEGPQLKDALSQKGIRILVDFEGKCNGLQY